LFIILQQNTPKSTKLPHPAKSIDLSFL